MKKSYSVYTVVLIFAAALALAGCAKDKQTQLSGTTWEVTGVSSPDGIYTLAIPVPIRLSFGRAGDLTLKLDVNSCMSTYTIKDSDKIKIEPFGCTKMCCDNESSEAVKSLLSQITAYRITVSQLELSNADRIVKLARKTE